MSVQGDPTTYRGAGCSLHKDSRLRGMWGWNPVYTLLAKPSECLVTGPGLPGEAPFADSHKSFLRSRYRYTRVKDIKGGLLHRDGYPLPQIRNNLDVYLQGMG